MSAIAVAFKNEGNNFFKKKQYAKAIEKYTEGIKADPSYHVLYSNRSQAYFNLGMFDKAAADGLSCIRTSPKTFVKGYHRLANAQFAMKKYKEALQTCKTAENKGFRGNRDINNMYNKCAPLAKKQQAEEIARLTGYAKYKAVGNQLFSEGRYEDAILEYNKVCSGVDETKKSCSAEDKKILVSALNNRALCYMQQQNYRQVIMDTTRSIGIDDSSANIKAYFRRATAFEGMEKYRSALEDIRKCTAAKSNWEAANNAQYRLDQAVRTLKNQKT